MSHPVEHWIETPQSSQILGFGYTAYCRRLTVQFKGGAIWDYSEVPHEVYDSMRDASSVGSCFGRFVKPFYAGVRRV